MPVTLKCDCGRQMRVADEHVGRRVKCPGCGEVRTVVAEKGPSTPAPKAKPAAAAPAAPALVRFACPECGKQMQARSEFAGKMTKCPGCEAKVRIPSAIPAEEDAEDAAAIRADRPEGRRKPAPAEDEAEDDRPRGKKGRQDDVEEAEETEEDSPRSKKKAKAKRGGMPLMLILGGGALCFLFLLCGGGGAFALWYFGVFGGTPADLQYVTDDAQMFVTVRGADLWKNDKIQKLIKNAPGNPASEMEDKSGFKPTDIERATIILTEVNATGPNEDGMWATMATTSAYDEKKVKDKLLGSGAKSTTVAGKTVWKKEGGDGSCVFFHDSKTIVFAPSEKAMTKALSGKPRKKDDAISAAVKLAAGGRKHIVVGFLVPSAAKAGMKNSGFDFSDMSGGSLALTFADKLEIESTLSFGSDAKAKEAKESLDGVKTLAKNGLKAQPGMDKFASALDTLKSEQSGKDVKVTMKLDFDPDSLMNLGPGLGAFGPGGFGQPPMPPGPGGPRRGR